MSFIKTWRQIRYRHGHMRAAESMLRYLLLKIQSLIGRAKMSDVVFSCPYCGHVAVELVDGSYACPNRYCPVRKDDGEIVWVDKRVDGVA